MVDFNMFNYLQLKGFSNEKLSEHFEKIFDTNTEINNILMGNSGAVLKGIKISYLDEEEKNIHFEVNIELSKRNVIQIMTKKENLMATK